MNWGFTKTYNRVKYPVPPQLPGNYAIYSLDIFSRERKLLYIGTSYDLKRRLDTHPIYSILKTILTPNEIPIFKIKTISNPEERFSLEKKLISRLNPPLNKIYRTDDGGLNG